MGRMSEFTFQIAYFDCSSFPKVLKHLRYRFNVVEEEAAIEEEEKYRNS